MPRNFSLNSTNQMQVPIRIIEGNDQANYIETDAAYKFHILRGFGGADTFDFNNLIDDGDRDIVILQDFEDIDQIVDPTGDVTTLRESPSGSDGIYLVGPDNDIVLINGTANGTDFDLSF